MCSPAARRHSTDGRRRGWSVRRSVYALLPSLLSCQHAVDPHHTPGDQRLKAIRQADLGENAVRVRAGPGSRVANTHGRARQPGRRATGGDQTDVVMLARGAQFVLHHPRILHEFGEIEDTAVCAKASRGATRHPVVHGLREEVLFQRPLQRRAVE